MVYANDAAEGGVSGGVPSLSGSGGVRRGPRRRKTGIFFGVSHFLRNFARTNG